MNDTYYVTFCVRDGKDTVAQVMDSLLSQTVMPSKITIVDDGSTDGTHEILQSYQKKNPELVELLETNSTTRDYSRIPKLWNLGLRKGYDYHMIGAGDAAFPPHYAERILKEMRDDPKLVICSGDYGTMNSQAPLGGGRFVRQSFFFTNYTEYPWILGYESEILERAILKGYHLKVFNDLELFHLDKLGHGHNFKEFGYGMKTLGYYPPYVFFRFVSDFFHNKTMGKKGALKMLWYYLFFSPAKTGYYSRFPEDIRHAIRDRQKKYVRDLVKRMFLLISKRQFKILLKRMFPKTYEKYRQRKQLKKDLSDAAATPSTDPSTLNTGSGTVTDNRKDGIIPS